MRSKNQQRHNKSVLLQDGGIYTTRRKIGWNFIVSLATKKSILCKISHTLSQSLHTVALIAGFIANRTPPPLLCLQLSFSQVSVRAIISKLDVELREDR
jgi:hypothetical protein